MIIAHEFVKVVNVQIPVSINTNVTDTTLNDLVLNQTEILPLVNLVFQNLENENPNFIVFPEYSFFPLLDQIFRQKSIQLNAIIISGTYISNLMIPESKVYQPDGSINIVQKHGLAPIESFMFRHIRLANGELPNIFNYTLPSGSVVKFLVLICYDFYDKYHKFYESDIDLLFVTAYNKT